MVFCNRANPIIRNINTIGHNPYFNRWFSAIYIGVDQHIFNIVTILILIDGFLQYYQVKANQLIINCHNPYFNRWFSAIKIKKLLKDF